MPHNVTLHDLTSIEHIPLHQSSVELSICMHLPAVQHISRHSFPIVLRIFIFSPSSIIAVHEIDVENWLSIENRTVAESCFIYDLLLVWPTSNIKYIFVRNLRTSLNLLNSVIFSLCCELLFVWFSVWHWLKVLSQCRIIWNPPEECNLSTLFINSNNKDQTPKFLYAWEIQCGKFFESGFLTWLRSIWVLLFFYTLACQMANVTQKFDTLQKIRRIKNAVSLL